MTCKWQGILQFSQSEIGYAGVWREKVKFDEKYIKEAKKVQGCLKKKQAKREPAANTPRWSVCG